MSIVYRTNANNKIFRQNIYFGDALAKWGLSESIFKPRPPIAYQISKSEASSIQILMPFSRVDL